MSTAAEVLTERLAFYIGPHTAQVAVKTFCQSALSIDPARLGLLTSAQVFGGLVGGLAIGWIADHVGTRGVTAGALRAGAGRNEESPA